MAVSKKVRNRFKDHLRGYCKLAEQQRARDVSEADTVTLVKDILDEVLGYDKYTEVTGEHEIRGTYCDLAIQIDGQLKLLIEVKAIGTDLNDRHVKQAVDYAANKGVDWVVLTNGVDWIIYHIHFKKPIEHEEIARVSLPDLNLRSDEDVEKLSLFTKEALNKNKIEAYRERKDATSKYMLAAIIVNCDDVLNAIRKNVRVVSDHLIDRDVIADTLREQVLKRDVVEGDCPSDASRKLSRALSKKASSKKQRKPAKKKTTNAPAASVAANTAEATPAPASSATS